MTTHQSDLLRTVAKVKCNRRGLNMIEVAISSLIVGVMLVASLRAVGQSFLTQRIHSDSAIGHFLAEGLLSEVLQQSYMEPGETSSAIQREIGELADDRSNYDDVDDYHNYKESPPNSKNNTPLKGFSGWQRTVKVQWVSQSDLNQTLSSESGIKRVVVEAYRDGTLIATAIGYRSDAP
jgi:hypothetical protein